MTKLNVVIPAVNVMVGETTYRKVDRKAQAGDIVKVVSSDYDMQYGGFYPVGDGPSVVDDVNDRVMPFGMYPEDFEVYTPVSAESSTPTYREVKRKAAVGERIKIVNPVSAFDYGMGDEFVTLEVSATGGARFRDNVGGRNVAFLREYVVLEPVTAKANVKPKRLTVGDYVKVVREGGGHNYAVGSVVKVAQMDGEELFYAEKADGFIGNVLALEQTEPATEAEFLAQRKHAEPARLKVGDYAKVVNPKSYREHRRGQIVEIFEDAHDIQPFQASSLTDGGTNWYCEHEITPATSEEVSAAQAEAQRKLAIGPFADGGFAQIIDRTKSLAMSAADTDGYVKVSVEPDGVYALSLKKPNGDYSGYCNADALRQITEAEYNAATAPEPKLIPVGKYGKIVRSLHVGNRGYIGKIVEIIGHDGPSIAPYEARTVIGGVEKYALADGVVEATPTEIAEARKEAQEIAKWDAIGRKVGELKSGDFVKVERTCSAPLKVGEVLSVIRDSSTNSAKVTGGWSVVATLIVPVEQRFDTEPAAA